MRLSLLVLAAALILPACREEPHATPPLAPTAAPACDETDETAPLVAWTLRPRPDGALELVTEGTPLLSIRHGGMRTSTEPARATVRRTNTPPEQLGFEVTFETLPVVIRGLARSVAQGRIRIDYTIETTQPLRDVAGVGLQVDVEPRPWSLARDAVTTPQDTSIEIEVPRLGSVGLDFGDTKQPTLFVDPAEARIRAAWLSGDATQRVEHASVTLSVPGSLALEPPVRERYGPEDVASWHHNALLFDDWPVDLQRLNRDHGRAGSHGRVVVEGEDLRFEDGTPARFWGTNVAASALFAADDTTIERQAKRLSALGYNLVRIHHHDSAWVGRNVIDTSRGTTQSLNTNALERLDRWIATLADEGIYVFIDVHTGREFLPGDEIPGYADMLLEPHPRQSRGFQYVNPRIEALMESFAAAYLTRKNPYTGRPWSVEPAVIGVLLTNENDLTHHFGVRFRPGSGHETHIAMFDALAETVTDELGLPRNTRRSIHRPGPGKVLLAEMQHRWDERALQHVRGLGVRAPMATTNFWGHESLLSIPPLAHGDIIDVHAYGDAEALSTNPHRQANWLHSIAMAQVVDKPLTVSEWAVPKPHADRFTAPLWVAALARLQGWDAVMAYNYAQSPLGVAPTRATQWDQRVDPAQLGLVPTAALLYRRGDVALARHTFALAPSLEDLWNRDVRPRTAAALRTAPERSRTVLVLPDHPALDWDRRGEPPNDAIVVTDLDADLLEGAREVRSDTGEIERDWRAGVLRIDAPRVQASSGWIGGRTISLHDFRVTVEQPKATVSAISLDGAPLSSSTSILVTAVGRAQPQDDGSVRSEPISGHVALRTQSALKLTALTPRSRAPEQPVHAPRLEGVRQGDWLQWSLPDTATHWFILTR